MGVLFRVKNAKLLSDMGWRRSELFITLTDIARSYYKLPSPVLIDLSSTLSECWVDEEPFCLLVEKAFLSPTEMLYSWARRSAGLYEVIKGECYQWEWDPRQVPPVATLDRSKIALQELAIVHPARQSGYAPEQISKKIMGPRAEVKGEIVNWQNSMTESV